MQLKHVFRKTSKKQILTAALLNLQKSASKDFIKAFPTYFSRMFLLRFPKRIYRNVKTVLTYFYMFKTIYKIYYHFEIWILF